MKQADELDERAVAPWRLPLRIVPYYISDQETGEGPNWRVVRDEDNKQIALCANEADAATFIRCVNERDERDRTIAVLREALAEARPIVELSVALPHVSQDFRLMQYKALQIIDRALSLAGRT